MGEQMSILINVGLTIANIGLLAVFIKLYTEVLKIGHIKNIGKATEPPQDLCRYCGMPRALHQGRCMAEIDFNKTQASKL